MAKTVRELSDDLKAFHAQLDRMVEAAVKSAALQQEKQLSDALDDRITKRFRTVFLFAGIVLAAANAVGMFGLRSYVISSVQQQIGTETLAELKQIKEMALEEELLYGAFERRNLQP